MLLDASLHNLNLNSRNLNLSYFRSFKFYISYFASLIVGLNLAVYITYFNMIFCIDLPNTFIIRGVVKTQDKIQCACFVII